MISCACEPHLLEIFGRTGAQALPHSPIPVDEKFRRENASANVARINPKEPADVRLGP